MSQRTVLITGAAKRIGAQLATAFGKAGYKLLLHANSSQDTLIALGDALSAQDVSNEILPACNFADRQASKRFAKQVMEEHRVDVLINNA